MRCRLFCLCVLVAGCSKTPSSKDVAGVPGYEAEEATARKYVTDHADDPRSVEFDTFGPHLRWKGAAYIRVVWREQRATDNGKRRLDKMITVQDGKIANTENNPHGEKMAEFLKGRFDPQFPPPPPKEADPEKR